MFDAIIIPGGGLTPSGKLPAWSRARFDQALCHQDQTHFFIPLSAGTTHKPPPLTAEGRPVLEAAVGAQYLFQHGISKAKVLLEQFSWDTIGNAFFARALHTDPGQLSSLLIITSEFHFERTQHVFEWVFNLPGPTPIKYQLSFEHSPNLGITPTYLAAREQRETESLTNLQTITPTIKSFQELHHWLFTQHRAYMPHRSDHDDPVPAEVLSTY